MKTVSRGRGATSRTRISMPLRLLLDSLEGAICWRAVAKLWRAGEDGEKCTVEGARVGFLDIETTDQAVSVTVAFGAHGAMAM
jgi:hypothetical protein